MEERVKPMNLQLFAEPAPVVNPTPTPAPAPAAAPMSATPEQIAASIISAIDSRSRRAETGVVKSYAEQYGMSEADIASILEAEKAKRASTLSPEQQKAVTQQLVRANERLVSAEIKAVGNSLGLLDTSAASVLMDKSGIKVKDDGTVEGIKEALETLKKDKPYMFGVTVAPKTGMRQRGNEGTPNPHAEANEALRSLFGKENR